MSANTNLPPYMFLQKIWFVYIQSSIINAIFIISKILVKNYQFLYTNEAITLIKFAFQKGFEVLLKWVYIVINDFNEYKIFLLPLIMTFLSIYEITKIDSDFKVFIYAIFIVISMLLCDNVIVI